MAKGLFTQGACLLTDGSTTIDGIRFALRAHKILVAKESPPQNNWRFGGPSAVIPFRPDVNGYAAVDVVTEPWPDTMGNPHSDPQTFAAWSMGNFGPFAFPGSLERAQLHGVRSKTGGTPDATHAGFIRIRMSHVFGASGDLDLIPADYDPVAEMMFVSRLVFALFDAPGVVSYFNPSGEVLCDEEYFQGNWKGSLEQRKLPLLLWMNVRRFHLSPTIGFMDTVGNEQLEIRDLEAGFPLSTYNAADIRYYLRNVTHYLLDSKKELRTGEPIDGPGETGLSWIIDEIDSAPLNPPRRTIRLCPKGYEGKIRRAFATAKNTTGKVP
jgi:hypothetical protein